MFGYCFVILWNVNWHFLVDNKLIFTSLHCLFFFCKVPLGCVTPFALINESARYVLTLTIAFKINCWTYHYLAIAAISKEIEGCSLFCACSAVCYSWGHIRHFPNSFQPGFGRRGKSVKDQGWRSTRGYLFFLIWWRIRPFYNGCWLSTCIFWPSVTSFLSGTMLTQPIS